MDYSSGMGNYVLGWNYHASILYYFNGEIPIAKFYKDKAFTLEEVQKNYNELKLRYNL